MKNVCFTYNILQSVMSMAPEQKMKGIVDIAISAGCFNTLITAVRVAGLVDTLKSAGPFTVFAPDDAAFKKIPPVTLDALFNYEQRLMHILKYHIIPGKILAADLVKQRSLKTLDEKPLSINASRGKIMVSNAQVIKADIMCDNGVIHRIDNVLFNRSMNI